MVPAPAQASGGKADLIVRVKRRGNRLEIIEYANIQFTKALHVLRGMGLALDKNEKARRELADKGMAEEPAR